MHHQHTNSEDTITTLFVEILMPMSATWKIYEQTTQPLVENKKKPDVIIRTVERYPMAVEVKIDYKRGPNETGEKQAREQYLGKTLAMTQEKLTSAMVIRIPHRFRTMPRDEISENLKDSKDFAYTLLNLDEPHRFPKKGWLHGSIADIATAIRIGATPITKIEQAAEVLESGIHRAAVIVNSAIAHRPHIRTYPHFFLNACVVVFIGFQCCHVSSSAVRKFISLKQVLSVNKSNASCVHTSRIIRLMTLITE